MLEIKNLSFAYPNKTSIFKNFSFNLKQGEIAALLGKSGSGKSTLLKLIYGIFDWDKGEIHFNGRKLLGPKGNLVPGEPDIKWVAQEFDLMPYTTVAENVGTYFSNIDLEQKENQIMDLLQVVDLEDFKDAKVAQLSGGQKQRVAIAKALSERPDLLLLDEPFSQIDTYLKNKLQRQLFQYVQEEKISVLVVTHNIQDALSFTERIDILDDGKIIESNNTYDLYMYPKKIQTANLLGDMNIIYGRLKGEENKKFFLHPFQIKVGEHGRSARVMHSYFKGGYYLIEAVWKDQIIYFQHYKSLKKDEMVKLVFKWQKPL